MRSLKLYVCIVFFLLCHFKHSYSQTNAKFSWAKHTTGSLNEYIQSIQVDNAGNTYACGYFSGSVDFDPGVGVYMLTAQGINDAFILKLSANGGFVWARQLSGPGDDVAYSCAIDKVNNRLFVGGYFSDSIDLDPGAGINKQVSKGSTDLYIIAIDFNANYLNALHLGGINDDAVNGIAVDQSAKLVATGYFQQTMTYGGSIPNLKNLTSLGGDDIFVLKWNCANSTCDWAISMGASGQQDGNSIICDSKNNIRIAGYFENNVDFDPGASTTLVTNHGNSDWFVLGLDSNAQFQWVQTCGSNLFENALSITVNAKDEVLSGGFFQSNLSIGNSIITSLGNDDALLVNISQTGNLNWYQHYGGTGQEVINNLITTSGNNLLVTGYFQDTVLFNSQSPSLKRTSNGGRDVFFFRADTTGAVQWVKTFGGSSDDWGNSVATDTNGNIFVGGFFEQLVDFNPGAGVFNLMALNDDAFLEKLSPCIPSSSTSTQTACGSYMWHATNYTTSGTYYYYGINYTGCDSLETLHLTILPSSSHTIYYQNCASQGVFFNGILHHQSGVFKDTLQNYVCCDSILSLSYTAFPSSSHAFTLNICANQNYWFNGMNLHNSGTYYDTLINYHGCDSFLTLHLFVNAVPQIVSHVFDLCNGAYVIVGQHYYTQSGIYQDTLSSYLGCDSIVITNLTIHPHTNTTINARICASNSFFYHSKNYTYAGVYFDTLYSKWGCDSIITINLKVDSAFHLQLQEYVCFNYPALSYVDTIYNVFGCDSILITHLPVMLPMLDTTVGQTTHFAYANFQNYCVYQWKDSATGNILSTTDTLYFSSWHSHNGTYYLVVLDTLHHCKDSSSLYYFNTTYIGGIASTPWKIYPTVTSNSISIEGGLNEWQYEIKNILGNTVLSGTSKSLNGFVDVRQLVNGTYCILIMDSNRQFVYKSQFIKLD